MGGLRDVGLGDARDRGMRAWPEPGRGCLPPLFFFESGSACAIGAQDGCTRVGGRERSRRVGFGGSLCLRHRTLSAGRPLALSIRERVCCLLCVTWGTYQPIGKYSVALVLILGWGRRADVCMTLVFILGVRAVTQVFSHGDGSLSIGSRLTPGPNPLTRRGGSARNACLTLQRVCDFGPSLLWIPVCDCVTLTSSRESLPRVLYRAPSHWGPWL